MSNISAIISDIEALSKDEQEKILFYMLSATDIRKNLEFLKYVNKITFGLISKSKVDVLVQ